MRRLLSSSSEDIFKMSSRRLDQDKYIRFGEMFCKRFFKTSCKDVFKTSSRLQDVFETPSRLLNVFETFSKRFQDVLKTSWRRTTQGKLVLLTGLQDVFKTFSRRLQDICLPDVFKMSLRHLQHLQNASPLENWSC